MRSTFTKIRTFSNSRADFGSERLTVVTGDLKDGIQIDLDSDGDKRASLTFDMEEVERLQRLLDTLLSRPRSGRDPSETFGAEGENMLVVTYTNWGDPYDEGARFHLTGTGDEYPREDELYVSLTNDELRPLSRLLGGLLRQYAAENEAENTDPAPR